MIAPSAAAEVRRCIGPVCLGARGSPAATAPSAAVASGGPAATSGDGFGVAGTGALPPRLPVAHATLAASTATSMRIARVRLMLPPAPSLYHAVSAPPCGTGNRPGKLRAEDMLLPPR